MNLADVLRNEKVFYQTEFWKTKGNYVKQRLVHHLVIFNLLLMQLDKKQ